MPSVKVDTWYLPCAPMVMIKHWSPPGDSCELPNGFAAMQPPRMDFFADWHAIMRQWLSALGVDLSDAVTNEKAGIRYFEVRWRLLQPRFRRTVRRARSLRCPAALQTGLDEVARKLECGEELLPHMSRGPVETRYAQDATLYDWGLHHFHLGLGPHPADPRFAERTRDVLFAHVTSGTAYLIDVKEHGRGVPPPWTDAQLIEILNREFPNLMIPAGVPMDRDLTPQERRTARSSGLISLTKTSDARVHFPLGGGVSTAGTSNRALERYDRMADTVVGWERAVWRELERMRSSLPPGVRFGNPPEFKLNLGDVYRAVETTAQVAFELP